MKGLRTAIAKLKEWLRKKQPEQIQVRTYAGAFKLPADKPLASMGYDQLVQYAEANTNLRRIALDQIHIPDGNNIKHEAISVSAHMRVFHQQMKELSLGWARCVVGLRNRIR